MIFSDFVYEITGYIILKFEMSALVSCQVKAPFYELSDQPSYAVNLCIAVYYK